VRKYKRTRVGYWEMSFLQLVSWCLFPCWRALKNKKPSLRYTCGENPNLWSFGKASQSKAKQSRVEQSRAQVAMEQRRS
jgi:hypothetical protein